MQLAPKLKEATAQKWSTALTPYLSPGEQVWALSKTNSVFPILDGIAITNARVCAFAYIEINQRKGIKVAVDADQISNVVFAPRRLGNPTLVLTMQRGEQVKMGDIHPDDVGFVEHYVRTLIATGYPPEIRQALASAQHAERQAAAQAQQVESDRLARRKDMPIVGNRLKDNQWDTLAAYSGPSELPWFVINSPNAGMLAAFEDRLIIAKVGGMTSIMAGSMGGGRITTFPYTDITNIEYNSGILNGVLEILTPSYQGSAQHDFWRGTLQSRNKASADPFTLSNCLPLVRLLHKEALPHLNELQRKIGEAKRPNIVVQHQAPPVAAPSQSQSSGGLADELRGLAELHQQGILDAAEFAAAKQATIAKHSG